MRKIIKTQRLTLRPLAVADAKPFAELVNDPAITGMTGSFPYPFDTISVAGRIEIYRAQMATGRAMHYAIEIDGKFAGVIGVNGPLTGSADAPWFIGYWLGKPYWGQGYATEAADVVSQEFKRAWPERTLTAGVYDDNPASKKLLEKIGYRVSGHRDAAYSLSRRGTAPLTDFEYMAPTEQTKTEQAKTAASSRNKHVTVHI